MQNSASYTLASRDTKPEDTIVRVGDIEFGGTQIPVIAGPCSIESRDETMALAKQLRALGINVMRGGAFKPRTSPYSFQGLGEAGLAILSEVSSEYGISTASEVMSVDELELVAKHVSILQIGARNMQNYRLLEAVGSTNHPVLLKRGMSSTLEELLCAAEYILAGGNPNVILCERGIRTFEPSTRFSFDVNSVPALKQMTHLPVIVDPSHASGRRDLVEAISRAAIAAGADGLIIEVHNEPEIALSDGDQSLTPAELETLLGSCSRIAGAVDRELDLRFDSAASHRGAANDARRERELSKQK